MVKAPTLLWCEERAETRQKTVRRFKMYCLTRPWEELSPGTPPSKHKQTDFCQSVNVNLYLYYVFILVCIKYDEYSILTANKQTFFLWFSFFPPSPSSV